MIPFFHAIQQFQIFQISSKRVHVPGNPKECAVAHAAGSLAYWQFMTLRTYSWNHAVSSSALHSLINAATNEELWNPCSVYELPNRHGQIIDKWILLVSMTEISMKTEKTEVLQHCNADVQFHTMPIVVTQKLHAVVSVCKNSTNLNFTSREWQSITRKW